MCDASYHYDDNLVGWDIIMLGNKKTEAESPIYWKSEVIRKVCTLPKAAKTRLLMRLVDDGTSMVRYHSWWMWRQGQGVLMIQGHFLESIGSCEQIKEKALRQSVACL